MTNHVITAHRSFHTMPTSRTELPVKLRSHSVELEHFIPTHSDMLLSPAPQASTDITLDALCQPIAMQIARDESAASSFSTVERVLGVSLREEDAVCAQQIAGEVPESLYKQCRDKATATSKFAIPFHHTPDAILEARDAV